MGRHAMAAALLVALAACGRGPAPAEEVPRAESPRGAAPAGGLAAFFEQAPVELADSRAGLEAQLGAPDSVSATSHANRHTPSVTDSVFTLHYPGLVVEIYRAGYDGKEMLAGLQVSDDRYLLADSPLRLGARAADIRRLLGDPTRAAGDVLEYTCEECLVAGHETVRFVLQRNALRRIEFRHWID